MLARLVELFSAVDDFCQAFQDASESPRIGNAQGPRGPDPGLAEAESITLLLVRPSAGFKDLKSVYNSPRGEVLRRYFPGLPRYERFIVLQQRAFLPWVACLVSKLGKKTGLYYIASTALPVGHNRRIGRHKTFTGLAAGGRTAMGWFFGFTLHLLFHDRNEIVALKLTPGHVADTTPVPALPKALLGKLFGEKGDLSKKLAEELVRRGLTLFTRVRRNRKSLPVSMIDRVLLNGRPRAETIIGSRQGRSSLPLPQPRLPGNGFLPMTAALVAYQLDPLPPKHAFCSHRPSALSAS